jgi:hypothetical protein
LQISPDPTKPLRASLARVFFFFRFSSSIAKRTERRSDSMLAVLTEAVATFLRHLEAKTGRGQRLFREAEEWIESEDMSWTFAFGACEGH